MPTEANAVMEEADALGERPAVPPRYETIALASATVHVVTIADPVRYLVRVAVVDELARVDQIAAEVCEGEGCVAAALNAGFFDPNNGLTTSYVVVDGALVADPRQNQRLVGNPDLASYMDRILNRSEFRRYNCEGTPSYAIALHRAPVPNGCSLVDAVGAGPQLLPQDTSVEEGFVDRATGRDALGSQSANARSAVGLTADGSVVMVMVAQVPGVSPSGMTMAQVAEVMRDRGVIQALNLDGGSSSTLIYGDTIHYGRLNASGERVQRPVKSILWVENLP
ncbi:MAG: phosphodiester glycosidase family protein [Leptolyngbya sp. DLM2.Bin27]|nr:MAG: phosphodiester glycosidase family protein [Leptolyngbya sp. DLM2.Bin27]